MEKTNTKPVTLNDNEYRTLQACAEYNGGDFYCSDDISVEGLTEHQVAGYMGQLVQKGLTFTYEDDPDAYPRVTTGALTEEGWKFLAQFEEEEPTHPDLDLAYIHKAMFQARESAGEMGTWMEEPDVQNFEEIEDADVPSAVITMGDGQKYIMTLQLDTTGDWS